MYSRIFLAKVDSIEDCLEKALPELKRRFGDSLTIDQVRETIGTRKLLEEATNACLRDNCASVRSSSLESGPWINIPSLYEKALQNKQDSEGCKKHGVIPYSHGICPFCTK